MVLVSVLVAVHNGSATIEAAVHSALKQTLEDVEVLAVDDGSTDDSVEILERLAATDSRVRTFSRPFASGGPAIPRNEAIAASCGRFLALLDQDDGWAPNKLEVQLPLFARPEVGLVYSDCRCSDGSLYLERFTSVQQLTDCDQILLRNPIAACTAVWRRELTEQLGGFAEDLSSVDDYDLWIRMVLAGTKVDVAQQPLALLNTFGQRLSSDSVRKATLLVAMWQRNLAAHPDNQVLRQRLSSAQRTLAVQIFREEQRKVGTLRSIQPALHPHRTPRIALSVLREMLRPPHGAP
jgi:glycosyltransferase involved in cell wall biosynthesis